MKNEDMRFVEMFRDDCPEIFEMFENIEDDQERWFDILIAMLSLRNYFTVAELKSVRVYHYYSRLTHVSVGDFSPRFAINMAAAQTEASFYANCMVNQFCIPETRQIGNFTKDDLCSTKQ